MNRQRSSWASRALAVVAAAVLAVVLGADRPAVAQGAPAKVRTISIAVSNHPTQSPSPVILAGMQQGFFEKRGIKLAEVIGSGSGGDSVRSVLQGDLAFGIVGTSAAVQAYLAGAPVVIIGGSIQSAANLGFVAKAGSPIKTIQDTVGKTVGYTSPGSATDAALRLSLDAAGITDKVKTRSTGGISEGLTALNGGAIDVAAITDLVLAQNPTPYQLVWSTRDVVPFFEANVIIARPQLLKDDPQLVKDFLAAYSDATEWVIKNPGPAAASWAAAAKLDPKVVTGIVELYVKSNLWAPNAQLSADGLKAVGKSMILLGNIKADPGIPWAKLLNQDFLPAAAVRINTATLSGQ